MSPMRMMLPVCTIGGAASTFRTRSAGSSPSRHEPALTRPIIWTRSPAPVRIWILPEPVRTLRSTGPFTVSVRSNMPRACADCAAICTTSQPVSATKQTAKEANRHADFIDTSKDVEGNTRKVVDGVATFSFDEHADRIVA